MPTSIGSLDCQTYGRTIRWTEAGDRPLPDGKFIYPRSVIGGVMPLLSVVIVNLNRIESVAINRQDAFSVLADKCHNVGQLDKPA